MLRRLDWASLRRAERKVGTNAITSPAGSATLPMPCEVRGHGKGRGDEGKAVGCVPPTALLSLGWQFDLIKIKAARSGLMLFFLYLPLSLIFLKDEFDGWGSAAIYSF
jgi:hypothetical protein